MQTKRAKLPVLQVAAVVALVGAIAAAVVFLERDRSRALLADDVKLWQLDDGTIRGAQFVTGEVTEEHWSLLEGATASLQSVNLSKTQNVAGGLERLVGFTKLRDLSLADCGWLDDAEVARIAQAHRLHSLDISGTALTDEGLRQFDFSELSSLTANRCSELTDETFEMLSTLDSLKTVSLKDVEISFERFERLRLSRADLAIVADPPELTWEQIRRSDVIPTQVDWLSDETDIDQFLRYCQLPHNWVSGRFDENARARRLALGGPGVSRFLPRILTSVTELESLSLVDTRLDGGLQHLPRSVTSLWLTRIHADSRLEGLDSITWLTNLSIRDAEFTPEQWTAFFAMVAANKSLTMLIVSGAEVPAGAFRQMRELPELRHLGLYSSQIADADLHDIGQITSLGTLDIGRIPISDAVLESWLHLPNLTYLDVQGGKGSPEMEQRLRERYPEARIHIR